MYTNGKETKRKVLLKNLPKGRIKEDSLFAQKGSIDFERKQEQYKIDIYNARQEKQASYLEVYYNCSKNDMGILKLKTDGLVRVISLEYEGKFHGSINKKFLKCKFSVSSNKILISSKGNAIDFNNEFLFKFTGKIKINRGFFVDFNGQRKKIHLLTNNNMILKQITGGNSQLLKEASYQGNIKFNSPSRSSYNFTGDYWNNTIQTFSNAEYNWDSLDDNYYKSLTNVTRLFKKSILGLSVNFGARGEDPTTKIVLPPTDSKGNQILGNVGGNYRKNPKGKKYNTVNLKQKAIKYNVKKAKEDKKIEKQVRRGQSIPSIQPGPMGDPDIN